MIDGWTSLWAVDLLRTLVYDGDSQVFLLELLGSFGKGVK